MDIEPFAAVGQSDAIVDPYLYLFIHVAGIFVDPLESPQQGKLPLDQAGRAALERGCAGSGHLCLCGKHACGRSRCVRRIHGRRARHGFGLNSPNGIGPIDGRCGSCSGTLESRGHRPGPVDGRSEKRGERMERCISQGCRLNCSSLSTVDSRLERIFRRLVPGIQHDGDPSTLEAVQCIAGTHGISPEGVELGFRCSRRFPTKKTAFRGIVLLHSIRRNA